MSIQNKLIKSFERNHWLANRFSEGLSFEDSLAQPPFKSNNFNWVLGHILVGRDSVLALLYRPSVLLPDETALYESGSELVTLDTAVTLKRLLAQMNASQDAIREGLQSATADVLDAVYDVEREQTVREEIEGLQWHDTYHIGQLEILRQVSAERESFP